MKVLYECDITVMFLTSLMYLSFMWSALHSMSIFSLSVYSTPQKLSRSVCLRFSILSRILVGQRTAVIMIASLATITGLQSCTAILGAYEMRFHQKIRGRIFLLVARREVLPMASSFRRTFKSQNSLCDLHVRKCFFNAI